MLGFKHIDDYNTTNVMVMTKLYKENYLQRIHSNEKIKIYYRDL